MTILIGAMLLMGAVMAFVELFVEFIFVWNLRPEKFVPAKFDKYDGTSFGSMKKKLSLALWSRVYNLGPWLEENHMHSVMFSLVLSIMLGMLFPVTGIIAFFGAVGSTVLGQPLYAILRNVRRYEAWRASGGTFTGMAREKASNCGNAMMRKIGINR